MLLVAAGADTRKRPRAGDLILPRRFSLEPPLPTVGFEDLALNSTRSADNTGVRVQVLRRQANGSWLRMIDRPEVPSHSPWPGPPP